MFLVHRTDTLKLNNVYKERFLSRHGCEAGDQCPKLKKRFTPALKKKHEDFKLNCERLLSLFPPEQISSIRYIQECQFEMMKKEKNDEGAALRKFCRTIRRPLK